MNPFVELLVALVVAVAVLVGCGLVLLAALGGAVPAL